MSSFLFHLIIVVGLALAGDAVSVDDLVTQLGDADPFVRDAASRELERRGMAAFSELRDATHSSDVEVATRASELLENLDSAARQVDNPIVAQIVELIEREPITIDRIWRMQWLTEVGSGGGFTGEGVGALCRILCFDADRTIRVEAAKAIIVLPPAGFESRKKWFQRVSSLVPVGTRDGLLTLVGRYARLWFETHVKETSPDSVAAREEIAARQQQVRSFAADVAAFQQRSEDHPHIVGSRNDILLFYAIADLLTRVALDDEAAKWVDAASRVVCKLPERRDEMRAVDFTPESDNAAHLDAARALFQFDKLAWTEKECNVVIAQDVKTSDKLAALGLLVEIAILRCDYETAAERASDALALVPEIPNINVERYSAEYVSKRDFCLATAAAEAGDWARAQKLADDLVAGVGASQDDENALAKADVLDLINLIDTLILRHRIESRDGVDDVDAAVVEKSREVTERLITESLSAMQTMLEGNRRDATFQNGMAWLMANTNRDPQRAMLLIRAAMRHTPESTACLDTLSHVYAALGDLGKAVETQRRVVAIAPEVPVFRKSLEQFIKRQKATPQ
ncbi:MAG: hypothetical protein ACRC46_06145 [Thermoguttaceae bacterium]